MKDLQILILAAGAATRFGSPKQLASFRGLPMLQHVIDAVLEAGYKPWLALGAHRDLIETHDRLTLSACRIVPVALWEQGMSASLAAGITGIVSSAAHSSGVLVLLGDQPMVTCQDLLRMVSVIEGDREQIVATRYPHASGPDTAGVPVYFPKRYFADLTRLKGARGAQDLIRSQAHQVLDLGGATEDVDYPEDLMRLAALNKETG